MSYDYKGAFASLPGMERGRALVLGADPKGKTFLYCNGRFVYIRDIEEPSIVDIYSEHSLQATVAKYSPSGFYIASADVSGKVRIWDTTQKEHLLKYEYRPFSGVVRDICWSPDSKRMVLVGDGKNQYGAPIMWDTGTSVGRIGQHTSVINSVDYKPTRPYRVITGGDDYQAVVHEGPPFKYKCTLSEHTKFVQVVRYSPDGNLFATGGSDGKVFLYDGKTGDLIKSLGESAHKGSVFGLTFSPDGKQVLTCSGDKTAKLWDVETASEVTVFKMGTQIEDMQQGVLWMGDNMLSVSLSGYINYLDKDNPDTPRRVLRGHINNITAMSLSEDKSSVYTGSHDGRLCHWDLGSGDATTVSGAGHGSQVSGMDYQGDVLASIGFDDQIKFINQETKEYESKSLSTESQPKSISCGKDGLVAVAGESQIIIYRGENRVFLQKEDYRCMSISIHPNQTAIAVGGSDNKVHIYNLDADSLSQINQLTVAGEVDTVAYSPDGVYLASGNSVGEVKAWIVAEDYKPLPYSWTFHGRSRIGKVAWSPDSCHFATSALDSMINVWEINTRQVVLQIKRAHQGSNITGLSWQSENTLLSAGYDKSVRRWQVSFS